MKILLTSALLAAALVTAGPVLAQSKVDPRKAERLYHKDGCSKCHSINKKKAGPAFSDISARYKGHPEAKQQLTEKLRKAGEDHPEHLVKDKDLNILVPWILADPAQGIPEPAWGVLTARQAGCLRCHAVEGKSVGPAWSEVAARNKNKKDAEERLTQKLKTAGDDHPEITVPEQDLKVLIPWLLTL